MKYKYRHQEWYKNKKIDVKSNSRADLIEKVVKKKERIDKQTVDEDMRLADFCELFLTTYKKDSVSSSWYSDLQYIARKLVDGIGNKPVGKITPIEVQSFLNSCSDLSGSTIKKIADFAKQIVHELEVNHATEHRFSLTVPRGRENRNGRSLTEREQSALLSTVKGHRGELFVLIMYYCGLRPSEVSALLWKDVDFEKRVIKVYKAVKKDGSVGSPKSASGVREVPIPSKLLAVLKKRRREPFCRVCEQSNGQHTKSSVRKMWASIKKDVEKKLGGREFDARLYDVRHTYCTNLEKAGVPINIASRLMGHSDISITSKIYTHATDEAVEIARSCIEKVSS